MPIDWEMAVIRGVKFMATKLINELYSMAFITLTLAPLFGTPGEPPIEAKARVLTPKPNYTMAIKNLYYSYSII